MVRNFAIPALMVSVLLTPACLLAQGKGNGINRGLGAAAKGAASAGMPRSGGPFARDPALRGGATLNRAGGLQRANMATARGDSLPTVEGDGLAGENPQRILDQRLDQAEHLRALSERNGNERLLDTADRMEASANRNFERQQQRFAPAPTEPTDESNTVPEATPAESAVGTGTVTTVAPSAPRTRRGFWFRSR
jgi:hypothetical protein